MRLRRGEIVLARVEFTQTSGGKIRPVVVIFDSGDDDCVVAPITSRVRLSDLDSELIDWREACLKAPSTIRVHKLTTISKQRMLGHVGSLSARDEEKLSSYLDRAFCSQLKRLGLAEGQIH